MKFSFSSILTILFFLYTSSTFSQTAKRVLFIGNSYTYVNDLPAMLVQAANSAGDLIVTDNSTPGGHTFQQHTTNPTTLSKVAVGNWDFVVLQEQSQYPSFPDGQVQASVFPYARKLDSIVNAQNACAETIFYMTWGRKNGDPQNCAAWPPVCSYEGMDSLLQLRYTQMANANDALLSPVAKVWRSLRLQFPALELYSSDESHPALAGSYAAACTFYSIIFRKDPTTITWNSTLDPADALKIRNTVKSIVFENLSAFNVGNFDPQADFTTQVNGNTVQFTNSALNSNTFQWNFGDGTTSTEQNPSHTFAGAGTFSVSLIAEDCGLTDTLTKTVSLTAGIGKLAKQMFTISPNPSAGKIDLNFGNLTLKAFKVNVIQSDGKSVFTEFYSNPAASIKVDLSSLPTGLYFLNIEHNEFKFATQKILISY